MSRIMSTDSAVPFETTLRVRDCCLCLHVQRAARALARRFDEALRPLGLTNGQFSLLMSPNRPEPPGMAPVAALLAMDRTTLTAALKPLERRGLVEVIAGPVDKRSRTAEADAGGQDGPGESGADLERTHVEVEGLIENGDADRLRSDLQALSQPSK